MKHPDDTSKEADGHKEEFRAGDTRAVVKTLGLDKVAKGKSVEWEGDRDLSLEGCQLHKHCREDFLGQRLRGDQRSQRRTRRMRKHRRKGREGFHVEEEIVDNVKRC